MVYFSLVGSSVRSFPIPVHPFGNIVPFEWRSVARLWTRKRVPFGASESRRTSAGRSGHFILLLPPEDTWIRITVGPRLTGLIGTEAGRLNRGSRNYLTRSQAWAGFKIAAWYVALHWRAFQLFHFVRFSIYNTLLTVWRILSFHRALFHHDIYCNVTIHTRSRSKILLLEDFVF